MAVARRQLRHILTALLRRAAAAGVVAAGVAAVAGGAVVVTVGPRKRFAAGASTCQLATVKHV